MPVRHSVVYHVGGGTLPKGNERKVFLNFRNNLIMLAKNLPEAPVILEDPVAGAAGYYFGLEIACLQARPSILWQSGKRIWLF